MATADTLQRLSRRGDDVHGKLIESDHGSPLRLLDSNKCLANQRKKQWKTHSAPKKRTPTALKRPTVRQPILTVLLQKPSPSEPVVDAKLTLHNVSGLTKPSSSITWAKSCLGEDTELTPVHKPRNRGRLQSYDGSKGRLQDQLRQALIRNSQDRHQRPQFLPLGQVNEIVTQQAVQAELSRCKTHMRKFVQKWKPLHAKVVCGDDDSYSFRKIFALLVLIERPFNIASFIKEDLHDGDLPLVTEHNPLGAKPYTILRKRGPVDGQPLKCFKDWTEGNIASFARLQWTMLAPVFTEIEDKKDCHRFFSQDTVLPFVSWEKEAHRSGNGQVYKVKIHPSHHNFQTSDEDELKDVFAVKELYSNKQDFVSRKEDFKLEVETLKRLTRCGHAHDHLITLLSSYEQAERYFLIFPWAGADLLGYWKTSKPLPPQDKETSLWLATQCHGLADALTRIHRYDTLSKTLLHPSSFARMGARGAGPVTDGNPLRLFGRHGDIKPNNILWFPGAKGSLGILKIADFGSVHFSTRNSVSCEDRGPIPNSATYQAPEWDLDDVRMLRSSYDIWTLGCVYLEFITWFMGGRELLEKFAAKRQEPDPRWLEYPEMQKDTFFTIDRLPSGKTARVKDAVLQSIKDLRSRPTCTPFFQAFLDIIQQDLLVVEGPDGGGRKSSANLASALYDLRDNCEKIPGYIPEG
ncbi:kinase-like protein [Lophiostoma macrostomum CBS 122681]|uniref:Kinase-like protein n=1 Tax=Lophiostoma macrostomum CBS 122681 TaxID=1314788 RepID=A0A6A6T375_9PLEO|nr:kinase-like protein [Lophiostoma macrostomum CBS 122681]